MSQCPVNQPNSQDACPVDHTTRSTWSRFFSSGSSHPTVPLSRERETSSIPKPNDGKWVYPSEAQFFAAMARKNYDPQPVDMKTIVPIHNAVNERAWSEILKWEAGKGGEACGGVQLVNFKGRPNDRSPKARFNMLLGYVFRLYFRSLVSFTLSSYAPPFDRHDWIVDRCGTRTRYIIDFYTGHSAGSSKGDNISFYLDVRPALDGWEGIKMRLENLWPRSS